MRFGHPSLSLAWLQHPLSAACRCFLGRRSPETGLWSSGHLSPWTLCCKSKFTGERVLAGRWGGNRKLSWAGWLPGPKHPLKAAQHQEQWATLSEVLGQHCAGTAGQRPLWLQAARLPRGPTDPFPTCQLQGVTKNEGVGSEFYESPHFCWWLRIRDVGLPSGLALWRGTLERQCGPRCSTGSRIPAPLASAGIPGFLPGLGELAQLGLQVIHRAQVGLPRRCS